MENIEIAMNFMVGIKSWFTWEFLPWFSKLFKDNLYMDSLIK